jgi:hypothetical protein
MRRLDARRGWLLVPLLCPSPSSEDFYRDEYPVTLAVVLGLRGSRVGAEEVLQDHPR